MVDVKDLAAMIGQTYGNWFVIKFIGISKRIGQNEYMFLCKCTCGYVSEKQRHRLFVVKKLADEGRKSACIKCRIPPNCGASAHMPSQSENRIKEMEWLKSLSAEEK